MNDRLYRLIQIILTPVAFVFSFVAMAGSGRLHEQRSLGEVKGLLRAYVGGTVSKEEWCKFTLFRLDDSMLEDVRSKATRLAFPPREGDKAAAKQLLGELEAMN